MKFSRLLPYVLVALAALSTQFPNLFPSDSGTSSPPASAPSASGVPNASSAALRGLPAEAVSVLQLIQSGGPFPYRQDGTTFQNREGLLPAKPRGYYREYTIPTPGAQNRGARRWVVGGQPPEAYYYTADHYRSFRKIEVQP